MFFHMKIKNFISNPKKKGIYLWLFSLSSTLCTQDCYSSFNVDDAYNLAKKIYSIDFNEQ